MKVLWLNNFPIVEIAKKEGLPIMVNEGWIQGMKDSITEFNTDIQLVLVFPQSNKAELVIGTRMEYTYYGYYRKTFYDKKNISEQLTYILDKEQPDVIHIHGTEFYHSWVMLNVGKKLSQLDKIVISIQGLTMVCGRHYLAGLPERVIHGFTFRDFVRCKNILQEQKKMLLRGKYEQETLRLAAHVIGRTDFDYACSKAINPDVNYHPCGEVLRTAFYQNRWSLEDCQRRSIFISQGYYPIKGLHIALEAFAIVRQEYPDAMLYIAGDNITKRKTIHEKLRLSNYGKYIDSLITSYTLKEHVCFLGRLSEQQMCSQYLKANVVVSPSVMENSSNSIGEAMLLGIPIVASMVGGTSSIITHKSEGLLYQWNEPYSLAYYICQIFEKDTLALELSEQAYKRALNQYNKSSIAARLIDIYRNIGKERQTECK